MSISSLVTEITGATPAVSQPISGIMTYVRSRDQETASELTSSSLNLIEVKSVSKFFSNCAIFRISSKSNLTVRNSDKMNQKIRIFSKFQKNPFLTPLRMGNCWGVPKGSFKLHAYFRLYSKFDLRLLANMVNL